MTVLYHAQALEGKYVSGDDKEHGDCKVTTGKEEAHERQSRKVVPSLIAVGVFEDLVPALSMSPQLVVV